MAELSIARLFFAISASIHIIFPISIMGLMLLLLYFESKLIYTKKLLYIRYVNIIINLLKYLFPFAIFTGITLSYQLDVFFKNFYQLTENILYPLRKAEFYFVAFFESFFIGSVLFYWKKIRLKYHITSVILLLLSIVITTFFITVRNSWMQTPAGYSFDSGILVISDWLEVIFNPSFLIRYLHIWMGAILCALTLFFYFALKNLPNFCTPIFRARQQKYLVAILLLIALQIVIGDFHIRNTEKYQPAKFAAAEGIWKGGENLPFVLYAKKDKEYKNVITIPSIVSLFSHGNLETYTQGLNDFQRKDQPSKPMLVFWSFRIMIYCTILLVIISLYLLLKKRLIGTKSSYLLILLSYSAYISGWIFAETGRQPWVVYGLIRTDDIATTTILPNSLIAFSIIYLSGMFFLFFLLKKYVKT